MHIGVARAAGAATDFPGARIEACRLDRSQHSGLQHANGFEVGLRWRLAPACFGAAGVGSVAVARAHHALEIIAA
jgi:hypothetical protein